MSASTNLPKLYVEGADDKNIISALLRRHGLNTEQGNRHLHIQSLGDLRAVLKLI